MTSADGAVAGCGFGAEVERMTPADLAVVLSEHDRYWGGRDLRSLHQQVFVHEFGDTCLVARSRGGGPPVGILGYLIGFTTPNGTGYIHLVAVRHDARGRGLARMLYAAFGRACTDNGAVRLKAITSVTNSGSIAFHAALGFEAVRVADHAGPGQPRMVFRRPLPFTEPAGG